MLLHQPLRLITSFSTSTPLRTTSSLDWRTKIKQTQLVSQISSILLQRKNWIPLLQNLNLSSKLSPPLFLQILDKTRTDPQISLSFFNWARTNLQFKPDLKTYCHIIQIAAESGLSQLVKPIADSLVRTHPASAVAESMIQAFEGGDFQSNSLSLVLECFAQKGLPLYSLEVLRRMRAHKCIPSVPACTSLLDALQRENEIGLALCCYGAMIRDGVLADSSTWPLVAQIICKDMKLESIIKLIDMGIYTSMIYSLVIDCFSKRGDLSAAFSRLKEMCDRKLNPGFSTYSSILDGACKYEDAEMIKKIRGAMVEEKLLLRCPLSENDSVIQKLCNLGKIYAAKMVFKEAGDAKVRLEDSSYGCLLTALSKGGRTKEAIGVYRMICRRGVMVNDDCYEAFVNALCKEDNSEEFELLRDVIRRGFSPCASVLSEFIASKCCKGRWREAEDLLDVLLEMGSLPDSSCCCSLVQHYCSTRQINRAMKLHDEIEKFEGNVDTRTYNLLLNRLFRAGRIEDAVRVFDSMKSLSLLNSASFTIIISELCRAKELRKAMKIHDEMLKLGMKPDEATYKRLISGFKQF